MIFLIIINSNKHTEIKINFWNCRQIILHQVIPKLSIMNAINNYYYYFLVLKVSNTNGNKRNLNSMRKFACVHYIFFYYELKTFCKALCVSGVMEAHVDCNTWGGKCCIPFNIVVTLFSTSSFSSFVFKADTKTVTTFGRCS